MQRMKRLILISCLLLPLFLFGCKARSTSKHELEPQAFSEKLTTIESPQLIDVRTPAEFEEEHLSRSLNIDWNSDAFETNILVLDKSKPVFVYCRSGHRSADAADKMRKQGFKEVYELKGGILKWKAAGLQEETAAGSTGMSSEDFEKLLTGDKLVLIDFYADWCKPCKIMAPSLDELQKQMPGKLTVIRIDVDKNEMLARDMKIEALPTLLLYKNKILIWSNIGLVSKDDISHHLTEAL
jgi:thioredoxin